MAIPSRVQASGNSPLSTTSICGDGATELVAVGSTIADALQLSAVWNTITTSSASTGVILPPTEVGAMIGIRNDSGQTVTVYPKSGSTINAAASTLSVAGLTAVGSTRADALQLTKIYNSVDTAASGTGVLLPPTQMGATIYIANSGANTIKVYPYESATTINQTTSASIASNFSSIFFAVSATKWYSLTGART